MIKSILQFGLTRSAIVVLGVVVFCAAGIAAFTKLNIEAYPNPAPVILEITAQAPGLSAEEMEKYYTIPMEVGLYPTPGVVNIRSTSFYGLSFVRVTFKYGIDYYFALTQAANSIQQNIQLPNNLVPTIQQSSLVGEIYRYQLVGPPNFGLTNLRTLQDYVVARRLMTIPGVVQINAWGGTTKQFNVDADLQKLEAYNITVPQLVSALGNANVNVGGREISIGQQSVNIRGIGLIDSGGADDVTKGYKVTDIENIVLSQSNGLPIQIKDVAKVSIGYVPRLGNRRQGQGRRHRGGDCRDGADQPHQRHHSEGPGGGRENQQRRHPSPRRQDRVLLRPQLAGERHDPHRAAQFGVRLHSGVRDPVGFPRRPAQRADRERQHSFCAVLRDHHPGFAGRRRQPALARCGGLWNHRRFRRHHDGKHIPKFPIRRRQSATASAAAVQRVLGARPDHPRHRTMFRPRPGPNDCG